jgi:hypothetical protein
MDAQLRFQKKENMGRYVARLPEQQKRALCVSVEDKALNG